jgi:hypothetical protein
MDIRVQPHKLHDHELSFLISAENPQRCSKKGSSVTAGTSRILGMNFGWMSFNMGRAMAPCISRRRRLGLAGGVRQHCLEVGRI